jgi:cytochrome c biogenesis protein CcmG/thiol:disulfide interchange protein DsbE
MNVRAHYIEPVSGVLGTDELADRGDRAGEEPPRRPGRWNRLLKVGSIAVAGVIVVLAAVELRTNSRTAGGSFSVANRRAQAEADGSQAPDFELPLLSGDVDGDDVGTLRLSSLRGSIVVLNFWASWCGPCREEAPDLQAAWVDYQDRGVRFVGVDERDDRAAALAFVEEFGITYPSVFDPAGSLADDYAFLGLPSTFVIDAVGNIAYRFTGFLDGPTLRGTLDTVIAGEEGSG